MNSVKEFDGRGPTGSHDKTILAGTRAKASEKLTGIPTLKLINTRISHGIIPSTPRTVAQGWTYVSLMVVDVERRIKPCEVSYDHVSFREPPRLISHQIGIIITNGDEVQRTIASVLPHDIEATEIPIRIISSANVAPDERELQSC